jgi:hypothetical protein
MFDPPKLDMSLREGYMGRVHGEHVGSDDD